jgi:hypothetical protein
MVASEVAEVFGTLKRGRGWVIESADRDWIIEIVEEDIPGRYVDVRRRWLVGLNPNGRRIAVIDRRTAAERKADAEAGRHPVLRMPPMGRSGTYIAGAPGTGKRR